MTGAHSHFFDKNPPIMAVEDIAIDFSLSLTIYQGLQFDKDSTLLAWHQAIPKASFTKMLWSYSGT